MKTFSYANENLQLLQLLDSEFFVHYQLLQTKSSLFIQGQMKIVVLIRVISIGLGAADELH